MELTDLETAFVAYLNLGYDPESAASVLFPREQALDVINRVIRKLTAIRDGMTQPPPLP